MLIVNDHCSNRILRLHLANLGIRFSAASGCSEALEMLRVEDARGDPFRLAILDLMAPDIDGLKLAMSIKEDAALLGPRLVMLCSAGQRLDFDLFRAVDFGESLVKPIRQSRLYHSLSAVLGNGEANPLLPDRLSIDLPDRQSSSRAIRILLAEDNIINQKVGLNQLLKYGYQADVVADGNEVLEALSRTPYDIIFMDCQMPEMDGYETTVAIRAREQDRSPGEPPVYIIAITANAMQGEKEKCLALGMNDYLSKPVQGFELQAALERWKNALHLMSSARPFLAVVT